MLLELYDVEVSEALISTVTDAVLDDVRVWQSRPLESVYPIVYFDCIVVKSREGSKVSNKAVYLAWTKARKNFWGVDFPERRSQVLARCDDRVEKPGSPEYHLLRQSMD